MKRRAGKKDYFRVPGNKPESEGDFVQEGDRFWVDPAIASSLKAGSNLDMIAARKNAIQLRLQKEAEEAKRKETKSQRNEWSTLKAGCCLALIILLVTSCMVWSLPPNFSKHYKIQNDKYKEHKSEFLKHVGTAFRNWRMRL